MLLKKLAQIFRIGSSKLGAWSRVVATFPNLFSIMHGILYLSDNIPYLLCIMCTDEYFDR